MEINRVISLQFAIFYTPQGEKPENVAKKVEEAMPETLNSGMTINSINVTDSYGVQISTDLPSASVGSLDGKYTANFSELRADLIINYRAGETIGESLVEFLPKVEKFYEIILNVKGVTRFGLVGSYIFSHPKPINALADKYYKNLPDNIRELDVRYSKRFIEGEFLLNDTVQISDTNYQEIDGTFTRGLAITRDLNNVPNAAFSHHDIIDIKSIIQNKFNHQSLEELIL